MVALFGFREKLIYSRKMIVMMMASSGYSPKMAASIHYSNKMIKMIAWLGGSQISQMLMQMEDSIVLVKTMTALFGYCQSHASQKVGQSWYIQCQRVLLAAHPCTLYLIAGIMYTSIGYQLLHVVGLDDAALLAVARLAMWHSQTQAASHLHFLLQTCRWRCWLGPAFSTPAAHCCLAGTVLHAAASGQE
jgi:hypothetical protein